MSDLPEGLFRSTRRTFEGNLVAREIILSLFIEANSARVHFINIVLIVNKLLMETHSAWVVNNVTLHDRYCPKKLLNSVVMKRSKDF